MSWRNSKQRQIKYTHCMTSSKERNQLAREQARLVKDGSNYKSVLGVSGANGAFFAVILISSILMWLVEFRGRNPFLGWSRGWGRRKAKSSLSCIIIIEHTRLVSRNVSLECRRILTLINTKCHNRTRGLATGVGCYFFEGVHRVRPCGGECRATLRPRSSYALTSLR